MSHQVPSWRSARLSVFAFFVASLAGLRMPALAGSAADDFQPWSTVQGHDGKFYGSMLEGGLPGGFAYSLLPTGGFDRVWRFPHFYSSPTTRKSGTNPEGTLGAGQDGSIYGATRDGGVFASGVVFKIDARGVYRVLHHIHPPGGGYKNATLAATNGDVFVTMNGSSSRLLRLAKDGSHTSVPVPGWVMTIGETANHDILVGAGVSNFSMKSGTLWRVQGDELQHFADVGYYPLKLLPLPNGDVLCLTSDRLLHVSSTGEVSVVRDFNVPFEGLGAHFVMVDADGSYVGTTAAGGLQNSGTLFRIAPATRQFTVLEHLPAPGSRGRGVKWMQRVFPLRVAAEGANRPPMAADDFVAANSLKPDSAGLPAKMIRVLKNDRDAEKDALVIVEVGSPEHGTVAFDPVAQTVTYTADSVEVKNDTFTYTITDDRGGRSTAHVFIRAKVAAKYVGVVSSPENPGTGDPGTPVGELSVRVFANRAAVARLEMLGKVYRFTGHFNEANQFGAVLESNSRTGANAGIELRLQPDGVKWLVVATIRKNWLPFEATCSPRE